MDSLLKVAASWILPALFFWFLFSFMAMTVIELIVTKTRLRQRGLEEVVTLLMGARLKDDFFRHPLANPLPSSSPAYISESLFAKVVMDWMTRRQAGASLEPPATLAGVLHDLHAYEQSVTAKSHGFGQVLGAVITQAGLRAATVPELLELIQKDLEAWFLEAVSGMSPIYRRRLQGVTLSVGVALSAVVNFDVIRITSQLWRASLARDVLELVQKTDRAVPIDLELLTSLPLGWSPSNTPPWLVAPWLVKIAGIVVGGFMIGIGSQYAFELLRRQVRVSR